MSYKINFTDKHGENYYSISGFPSQDSAIEYMIARLDISNGVPSNGMSHTAKIDKEELEKFKELGEGQLRYGGNISIEESS